VVQRQSAAVADEATAFQPLVAGGRIVDQRDSRVLLQVAPEPPWTEPTDSGRRFTWSARVRTAVRVTAPEQALEGVLRVQVQGSAVGADGSVQPYVVTTRAVTVTLP
jgi:hypothetical protein